MNGNPFLEELVKINILQLNMDILDAAMITKLVRRSVDKRSKTTQLLLYNSQNCFVSYINDLFEGFCCPSLDQFIKKLQTGRIFCQIARKELVYFLRIGVSQNRCITNLQKSTRFAHLIHTTKISLTAWPFLILNEPPCKVNF